MGQLPFLGRDQGLAPLRAPRRIGVLGRPIALVATAPTTVVRPLPVGAFRRLEIGAGCPGRMINVVRLPNAGS